jgi:putative transposase
LPDIFDGRGLLANHREAIVAFDFFTLPSLTFQSLYCFFAIEHSRRQILYFNVTRHPTSDWVVQQLREAFPEAGHYRYVIFDHDPKFDADVITFLQATGLQAQRTSVGKTGLRSTGSEAVATRSWTTSLH